MVECLWVWDFFGLWKGGAGGSFDWDREMRGWCRLWLSTLVDRFWNPVVVPSIVGVE